MISPRIRELAPYVPGLSITEIQEKYNLPEVIKLASNENPLGASPLAMEAICEQAASAFRYPQGGNPRLRDAIASLHDVSADQILVGNGSDEIIDLLMRLTAESGAHNIVCFEPCFSIYPLQGRINGLECRRLPLEPDFSFDFSRLIELADANTRLVFITTPDNPSGYCPPVASVSELAQTLERSYPDALLVIDEAYMDFAPDERGQSLLARGELPTNVIFLRTLSKSYGLAGARLGYAVASREIARAFWAARLPFSVNIMAEAAGIAAIADTAFRQATLEAVSAGRADLTAGLVGLGCHVWPSAANFLMFALPEGKDAQACHQYLLEHGVIIRPLKSYGLPENLRVSVGNQRENKVFLENMRRFLGA